MKKRYVMMAVYPETHYLAKSIAARERMGIADWMQKVLEEQEQEVVTQTEKNKKWRKYDDLRFF